MTSQTHVSEDEIARRAYEIWQSRGCPPGDGSEDWQAAQSGAIGFAGRPQWLDARADAVLVAAGAREICRAAVSGIAVREPRQ